MPWYRHLLLGLHDMLGGKESVMGTVYAPGLIFGITLINVISLMSVLGFDVVSMFRSGWPLVAAAAIVHALRTDAMIARSESERGGDEVMVAEWNRKWRLIVLGYIGGSAIAFGLAIALKLATSQG